MRLIAPSLLLFVLATQATVALAERLAFPELGFSIESMGQVSREDSAAQPLVMLLPPDARFAPNINVQVQDYPGSLEDYLALTRRQLSAYGLTWLSEPSISGNRLTLEYQGMASGRLLRWYQTATQSDGRVYLVTATALQDHWDRYADTLVATVRSFRLDP